MSICMSKLFYEKKKTFITVCVGTRNGQNPRVRICSFYLKMALPYVPSPSKQTSRSSHVLKTMIQRVLMVSKLSFEIVEIIDKTSIGNCFAVSILNPLA